MWFIKKIKCFLGFHECVPARFYFDGGIDMSPGAVNRMYRKCKNCGVFYEGA